MSTTDPDILVAITRIADAAEASMLSVELDTDDYVVIAQHFRAVLDILAVKAWDRQYPPGGELVHACKDALFFVDAMAARPPVTVQEVVEELLGVEAV